MMRYLGEYCPDDYIQHLIEGESVPDESTGVSDMPDESSRIVPIKYADGTEGQSVILDMASSGYIKPVEIVDPSAEFTVKTIEGTGTLFVQKMGSATVRRVRLRDDRNYTLGNGDVYGYVPKGTDGWVIRDDGNIPFEPGMERAVADATDDAEGGRVLKSIRRAHQVRNLST